MGSTWSQMFPPTAKLTEKNLPSQKGKVFIVTGGYSGVGLNLATILFNAGGKVYVAGRSESKAKTAIEDIKAASTDIATAGDLEFLYVNLEDLTTIKPATDTFKSKESRLDVLWNNAAVSFVEGGTEQGIASRIMGTNCVGPFLFTQLLLPTLQSTSATSLPGSTRVVWTSSIMVDFQAPKGGMDLADLVNPPKDLTQNYTNSKTANWFLASELARRVNSQGILSVTLNPGNLKTQILRNAPSFLAMITSPLLYNAIFGAYTNLWAGLSPELTTENNGDYVIPWGRLHPSPREDLLNALKSIEDGGSGVAGKFWEWCENVTADYQ